MDPQCGGSVYDLIPREAAHETKQARYVSKFRQPVKTEYHSNRADHKTMGQAKVPVPTTENFLKKHSKEPQLPDKHDFKYPDENRKKPEVPAKQDQPLMGLKTTKNFITTNAVNAITSVPRRPDKIYVDTKKGDKNLLEPSGMEPVFIHKKEYGSNPQYLIRRQQEMQRAQEEYNAYVAEHFRRGAMKQLTHDERQHILDGLKENWRVIHDQYQGLSVVTDTAPKKNRKERMEAEMKQLERDIESIEKHKVIYIAN